MSAYIQYFHKVSEFEPQQIFLFDLLLDVISRHVTGNPLTQKELADYLNSVLLKRFQSLFFFQMVICKILNRCLHG